MGSRLDEPKDLPDWIWNLQTTWTSSRAYFTFRDCFSILSLQYHVSKALPKLGLTPYFDPEYRGRSVKQRRLKDVRADATGASYEYTVLASDHIRLLTIKRGPRDAPLHGMLAEHSIHDLPEYQALSYTWGNNSKVKTLFVTGKSLDIHANASGALIDLRSTDQDVTIWVDAICINQGDDAERASQVRLMQHIYAGASLVPIWIKSASDETERALSLMEKLVVLRSTEGDTNADRSEPFSSAHLDVLGLPEKGSTHWKALSDFIWSGWFSRVWIIQEISLTKTAVVVCGSQTCSWPDLVEAAKYISDHALMTVVDLDPLPILRLSTMIVATKTAGDLLHMMQLARHSRSSDARDKVYALLGLASNTWSVVPDYTIDAAQCYTESAFRILQDSGTLDVLNSVEHWGYYAAAQRFLYEMPSWAPKWSISGLSEALPASLHPGPHDFHLERASRNLIEVNGAVIGTVRKSGDTFLEFMPRAGNSVRGHPSVDWVTDSYSMKRWRQWETIARHSASDRTREEVMLAYVQTIVANTVQDKYVDPAKLLHMYQVWLRFWRIVGVERGRYYDSYASSTPSDEIQDATSFMSAHHLAAYGRRFVVTEEGQFGLCPFQTRRGDTIVVLSGGRTPYVLRKQGQMWKVLGECYVHGLRPDILRLASQPHRSFLLC